MTIYYKVGSSNDLTSSAAWSTSSGGASGTAVPGAGDTVVFDFRSAGATTLIGDLTVTNLSADNFGPGAALTFSGNITATSANLQNFASGTTFANLTLSLAGGSWSFAQYGCAITNLTITSSTLVTSLTLGAHLTVGNQLILSPGASLTLDANGYNVTTGRYSDGNSANSTTTMGSGTWTLTGTGGWTVGGSVNAGTSTLKFTDNSATTKQFFGGGKTYATIWNATGGGTGGANIRNSNTIGTLKVDPGCTQYFDSLTTTTIGTLTANGTSSAITLAASGAGSAATIAKSSAALAARGCKIKDITTASGSIIASECTNVSGNTGVLFYSAKFMSFF